VRSWVSQAVKGGEHFREGARVGEIGRGIERRHFSHPVEIGAAQKRRPAPWSTTTVRSHCAQGRQKPPRSAQRFRIEGIVLSARSSVTRRNAVCIASQAEPGRRCSCRVRHFDRKGSRFAAADAERAGCRA